jgi:peptidyl-tRNA hydrolase
MQLPYRQVPDSLDFQLVRAKLKVGGGLAGGARGLRAGGRG